MLGFNGGLLGKRREPTVAVASGLWSPNEQSVAKRAGTWPLTGRFRYYRFADFSDTSLNANTFEIAEVEFYHDNTLITGATASGNFSWGDGSFAQIVNGSTSDRNYRENWSSIRSTASIVFDLGLITPPTHLRIYVNYGGGLYGPRFPSSFVFSGSNESNANFTNLATVTVGTSLNVVSQDFLYVTDKIAIQ
jgi:hypothetical protein